MLPLPNERCTKVFRGGRRCRMLRSPHHPALCMLHARQAEEEADASDRPVIAPGRELDTRWAVRRALRDLYREVARGRISPNQANVLASLARLLLIRTRRTPRKRSSVGPVPR